MINEEKASEESSGSEREFDTAKLKSRNIQSAGTNEQASKEDIDGILGPLAMQLVG